MDDDVEGRQELRLIQAFLSINDARKRQRVLNLAEQLADDAASDAAGLAATRTSVLEERGDVPSGVE